MWSSSFSIWKMGEIPSRQLHWLQPEQRVVFTFMLVDLSNRTLKQTHLPLKASKSWYAVLSLKKAIHFKK